MQTVDEQLVAQACLGSEQAFATLVERYSAMVYAMASRKLRSGSEAEDIVQEVFIKAWKGLRTLSQPAKFGSWVYGIAGHVCIDRLRKLQRTPASASLRDGESEVRRAPDSSGEESPHEDLKKALDGLPEIYREVLDLLYYQEMTYQEIADVLVISKAAVNARITKARQMMREKLSRSRSGGESR